MSFVAQTMSVAALLAVVVKSMMVLSSMAVHTACTRRS